MVVPKEKFKKDIEEEKKSWELELTKETESDFFAITWIIRDVWWDLIEEVKIVDMYENDKKFWESYKSLSIKIVFRSIERTLTNEEINIMYFDIRDKLTADLGYELR
jgi:phenylalanyl-tRNA synthetase beta subunit